MDLDTYTNPRTLSVSTETMQRMFYVFFMFLELFNKDVKCYRPAVKKYVNFLDSELFGQIWPKLGLMTLTNITHHTPV